jgi:hypothetical protein
MQGGANFGYMPYYGCLIMSNLMALFSRVTEFKAGLRVRRRDLAQANREYLSKIGQYWSLYSCRNAILSLFMTPVARLIYSVAG